MRRVWVLSISACALWVMAGSGYAQTTFSLGFDGDSSARGNAGDPWSGVCTAILTADGSGTGAQGWSISVTADNASITDVTTAGTDVDALFDGGFKKSELTTKGAKDCAGHTGAVSATVLSFTNPVTLPAPPSQSSLAKLTVGGTIPDVDGSATVRFVNGCQGAGQPVDNNITQDGATVAPNLGSKTISLNIIKDCCSKPLNVGFTASLVSSSTAYDGILDDGSGVCSGGGGTIAVQTATGATGSGQAFASISSNGAGEGAQGWSFSFALGGDIVLSGVTTNGTVVDGLFDGGFKKTEAIDPAKNGGANGAVSAVVLSFTNPVVLPPTGTASVVDFLLSASGPQGPDPISGSIRFQSGLRGSGQPVNNAITVGGSTADACNFESASVTISFIPLLAKSFVRGNANEDSKVDIGDAIWIINELFKGGPSTACPDAADANNDGQVDLADATFLVEFEFGGSLVPPPAPYPTCGTDPEGDDDHVGCDRTQTVCP